MATDYNESNVVRFRALPVADIGDLKYVFDIAVTGKDDEAWGGSNGGWPYKYCVVDLNPDLAEYNLDDGTGSGRTVIPDPGLFPVTFDNGVKVNEDDTYKTSKIVL